MSGSGRGGGQRHRAKGTNDTESSHSNTPLVIVSERGRHSDAQRRVVRAQAARASAAQSRVTRARNREVLESHSRVEPLSPESPESLRWRHESSDTDTLPSLPSPPGSAAHSPLLAWLNSMVQSPVGGLSASIMTQPNRTATASMSTTRVVGIQPMERDQRDGQNMISRQLPVATPRGFTTLQQQIAISDSLLYLMTTTACFDSASPGVEQRLNKLLYDLIMDSPSASGFAWSQFGHPIQGHLRIACICLTLVQRQKVEGEYQGYNTLYGYGLQAAWAESIALGDRGLVETQVARPALWALFVISVTAGANLSVYHQLICNLMDNLDLRTWEQVRWVLLGFIYPVSLLDEPCKRFYMQLRSA